MKRALGKGSDRDGLPSIDQLTSEQINGLYRWHRLRDERQRALPSSHRRASQQGLHIELPCCFEFLHDSAGLDRHASATAAQRFGSSGTPRSRLFDHAGEAAVFCAACRGCLTAQQSSS